MLLRAKFLTNGKIFIKVSDCGVMTLGPSYLLFNPRLLSERCLSVSWLSTNNNPAEIISVASRREFCFNKCILTFKAYSLRDASTSLTFNNCTLCPHCINPLNSELNPICYLLALLAHHFLHVSRIRVKSLTLRLLMSYIYGAPILDVSRSHTTTQHSR